jgi:IS30 family transposase
MSRTPRQIAGRLRLEAADASVGLMDGSLPAGGATASHEALYQFIYALPKGELARHGILLRTKRTRRKPRTTGRAKRAPIVGMVSIDARDPDAEGRRVPGHWESQCCCQDRRGALGRSAAPVAVRRILDRPPAPVKPRGPETAGLVPGRRCGRGASPR